MGMASMALDAARSSRAEERVRRRDAACDLATCLFLAPVERRA